MVKCVPCEGTVASHGDSPPTGPSSQENSLNLNVEQYVLIDYDLHMRVLELREILQRRYDVLKIHTCIE